MNKETEPFFTAEDKEHLDIAYGRTLAQADEIHTLQQQVEHLMGRFCPRESYDIDMEIKKLYDKSDQLWKMLDEMKQPKPREATISKTETVEKGRIATAREYLLSKGCLDVPDSRFMHNMTELCTLMDKFANSLREQWQREAREGIQPKTDKEIEAWYLEQVAHPRIGDTLDMLIAFQRFLYANVSRDKSSRVGKEDK